MITFLFLFCLLSRSQFFLIHTYATLRSLSRKSFSDIQPNRHIVIHTINLSALSLRLSEPVDQQSCYCAVIYISISRRGFGLFGWSKGSKVNIHFLKSQHIHSSWENQRLLCQMICHSLYKSEQFDIIIRRSDRCPCKTGLRFLWYDQNSCSY